MHTLYMAFQFLLFSNKPITVSITEAAPAALLHEQPCNTTAKPTLTNTSGQLIMTRTTPLPRPLHTLLSGSGWVGCCKMLPVCEQFVILGVCVNMNYLLLSRCVSTVWSYVGQCRWPSGARHDKQTSIQICANKS